MTDKRKLNELQEGKVLLMTEDPAARIEMILGLPDDMDFLEMCRRLLRQGEGLPLCQPRRHRLQGCRPRRL